MTDFKTLGDLIRDAITQVSEVNGAAHVQLYSEGIIASHVVRTFNLVATKRWWPQLMTWVQRDLDGVTGMVTSNITNVTDYKNVRVVFYNGTDEQIPRMPADINPFGTGIMRRFHEPVNATGKLLRVLPMDTSGTVEMHCRVIPFISAYEDVVPFDPDTIMLGAVASHLAGDNANPADESRAKQQFQAKLQQEYDLYDSQPVVLDGRTSGYAGSEWRERW